MVYKHRKGRKANTMNGGEYWYSEDDKMSMLCLKYIASFTNFQAGSSLGGNKNEVACTTGAIINLSIF